LEIEHQKSESNTKKQRAVEREMQRNSTLPQSQNVKMREGEKAKIMHTSTKVCKNAQSERRVLTVA
jgi:hypothetical protein